MADNNHNMIKPVESLQNTPAPTPAKRREERKRRHNLHEQNKEEGQQEPNSTTQEDLNNETPENQGQQHSIDYCA